MKKQTLFIAALAVSVAVSCSKSEQDRPPQGGSYIRVTSTISGQAGSRAAESDGSTLSDFGFVHTATTALADGEAADFTDCIPFTGSRAAGATSPVVFTAGSEPKYDFLPDQVSYLMGYRPVVAPVSNVVTWPADGHSDVMVSNLWKAGTYLAPITTGMEFSHILAYLQVKCVSAPGVGSVVNNDLWGKIGKIEVKNAPATVALSYADNKVTFGTTTKKLAMMRGAVCDEHTAFTPIKIQPEDGTTIDASVLVPPMAGSTITLVITTENQDITEVEVSVAPATSLQGGKLHSITLIFDANDKTITAKSAIVEWWGGNVIDKDVVKSAIMEFGVAPNGLVTEPGMTRNTNSYNALVGENAPPVMTNGEYYTDLTTAYTSEPPYYKLMIANSDGTLSLYSWQDVQGTGSSALQSDICIQEFGYGWRVPRLSELKMIQLNTKALSVIDGFIPLNEFSFIYYSSTENDINNAWGYDGPNKTFIPIAKTGVTSAKVRCVREI